MKTNYNNLFLIRLFRHSKFGFGIILLYILCYAIFFSKKMDMMIFPYNSMFSSKATETATPYLFAVKVDGKPIKITNKLYWKKDFLEQAPAKYADYLQNQKVSYLEKFIDRKKLRPFFNVLTPARTNDRDWFCWYANFAGVPYTIGSVFELVKYDFEIAESGMIIRDSTTIIRSEK